MTFFLIYSMYMPLAFQSISHGEIAFGFFNIETDMLLLNNYFFFASEFCHSISTWASHTTVSSGSITWDGYVLSHKDIGNLMGAIHGFDMSGFIGDTYTLFPFPKDPSLFKQNPEGYKTQETIKGLIERYAHTTTIPVREDRYNNTVLIGEYLFSKEVFHELLNYVWLGGYPRWKDEIRPPYVIEMKEAIIHSTHPLFKNKGQRERGA